jgi:hypothetical protein
LGCGEEFIDMAMRDETRMLLESMGRLFEDKCT